MQPPLRLFFGVIGVSFCSRRVKVGNMDSEVGCWQTKVLDSVVWGGEQENAVTLKALARFVYQFSPPFLLCLPYVEI